MKNALAVNWSDYEKFGCVNCGCEYCYGQGISGGGTSPVVCGECEEHFVILADGLTESSFSFGENKWKPILVKHPRNGTMKHEYIRPDEPPIDGGEWWNPRGVGYDLSGFVKCKQAGERIIAMIKNIIEKEPKSWLDYRKSEPNWIQVKIQSDDGFNLEKLCELCNDGIITSERLKDSLRVTAYA